MFKKTLSNGYFKKSVDAGHIGLKSLHNPVSSSTQSSYSPENSNSPKVSGVLQKIK